MDNSLEEEESAYSIDSDDENSSKINIFYSFLNDFANIFNYERYNSDFIKYLKSIEIPNTQVCSKIFHDNYYVQCSTCDKTGSSCICLECYKETKNLHENHNIKFEIADGFCDCGHIQNWPKEKFCSKHKGIFSSLDEINNYIKKSFSDEIINKIHNVLDNIFSITIEHAIINEKSKKFYFDNFFSDFINFLTNLTNNNLALLHIIATHLSKNYSNNLKVKHKCVKIEQNNFCNIIPSNEIEEHNCICSAIKIILTSWTNQKYEVLLSFKVNFKISEEIGLTYLFIFSELLKKNEMQDLSISYAYCELEYIKEFLKNEKNYLCILDYLYEEGIKLKEKKIDLHLYVEKLKKIYTTFKEISKPFSGKPFINNLIFFLKIVDLLDLFHNFNFITNEENENYTHNINKEDYLNLEMNLLNLLSFFIQVLDDENKFNKILEYIISKIINNYEKNNIKENEFSVHILLIRGFGMILNKYCFYFSIKKNIDLFQSFQLINLKINSFCKSSYLYEIIIKQLFKLLGFILSIKCNFWNKYYYDIIDYYHDYFNYYLFYLNDQVLFKYMISLKENQKFFSIKNIIQMASILNSNKNFLEKIIENDSTDLNWIDENETNKNFKLIKLILEVFYRVVRCNNCLIDLLGFSYFNAIYYKLNDSITLKILEKEEENIKNLVKEKISIRIIKNNNLLNYNDCVYSIFPYIKEFLKENKIQEIFSEITNKIKRLNEQMLFSLKNENLKKIDISYIYSPYSFNQAENYFLSFKKDEFNILNTYFIPFLSVEETLGKNGFLNFFFNEENYNFIFKFINIMYSKKEFYVFQNYFVNIFLRIILNINILKNDSFISKNINRKKIEENIINFNKILQNNKIEDNFIVNLNEFVLSEFNKYSNNLILDKNNNLNSINEINSNSTKNIKKGKINKLKEKFKAKTQKAKEKFLTDENINLLNKENNNNILNIFNEENCLICHKSLQKENKLYGKIYYILHDNLFSKNIQNNIENEIKKKKLNNLIEFKVENNDYNLSIRLTSCQHNFHYECYKNIDDDFLVCPFCKKIGNYFVPSSENILNLIKNDQLNEFDYFKFLNNILLTDDLFEMYKNFINFFDEFIYNFDLIELQNFYIEFWNLIFIFLKYEINKNLNMKNNMFKFDKNLFSKEINKLLIENLLYNEIFDINYTKNSIINEYSKYYYFFYYIKKLIIKEQNSIFNIIQNLNYINFTNINEINEKCFDRLFKTLCVFDLIVNNYNTFFFNEHKINFDLLYENFTFNNFKNYPIKKIILNENNILNLFNYEKDYNYNQIVNFIDNIKTTLKDSIINSYSFKKELILINTNLNYNFITLPIKFQDLILKYHDEKCFICKDNLIDSVICLTCEKKICSKHINENERDKFIIDMHYKKCIIDMGAFLNLKTGTIFYLMKYTIKYPQYDVYLNNLGENIYDDTTISNDYVINIKELKKTEKKFFNLDFI